MCSGYWDSKGTVMNLFDLAIIGAGPGGFEGAILARRHGLKVALIDKSSPGGTCLNWGCIPTKALLSSAKLYSKIKDSERWGISANQISFDWASIQKRKEEIVNGLRHQFIRQIEQSGVEWVQGEAELTGNQKIEVNQNSGKKIIEAKNIILATGSRPGSILNVAYDGKFIFSSDHLLEIDRIPKSLVIIGGGAIGLEFASLFHAFGCEIILLEMMDRILPLEDEDCAKRLETILSRRGIEIVTNCKVKEIQKKGNQVTASLEDGRNFEAEAVLIATGRKRNTEDLGLAALGIQTKPNGAIVVNEFLESSVKGVYAIGDILESPQLAHAASYEGECVVHHLISGSRKPMDYRVIPSCVYSDPEVASVGSISKEDEANGISIKIPFQAVAKAQVEGETEGFFKLVASSKGELLKAAAVGSGVSELMPEAALAIRKQMTLQDIVATVHAHPTASEVLQLAAKALVPKQNLKGSDPFGLRPF